MLNFEFGLTLDFLKFAVLTLILTVISWKDIKTKTISNGTILILFVSGLIFLFLTMNVSYIIDAVGAAVVVFALMSFASFLSKGSIGMGDVKLLSVVTLYIGSMGIFNMLFLSTLLAGLYSIGLLVFKKAERKSTIPFAPFITLGLLLTIITA